MTNKNDRQNPIHIVNSSTCRPVAINTCCKEKKIISVMLKGQNSNDTLKAEVTAE